MQGLRDMAGILSTDLCSHISGATGKHHLSIIGQTSEIMGVAKHQNHNLAHDIPTLQCTVHRSIQGALGA